MRTYRLPGLTVTEHTLSVPLDHFGDTPGEIDVFARVYTADPAPATSDPAKPHLLFLQGGPGFEAPRATRATPAWLARALQDFSVVMLDQRGTGRSTPVGFVDGHFVGTGGHQTPHDVAGYLTHFRADAIVEDAEALRRALGLDTWAVLGQSFGGFTALRYLAEHPDSLERVMFTGGLPRVPGVGESGPEVASPADADPAVVYRATWATLARKADAFFDRYPHAREAYIALYERAANGIDLPDGTAATQTHIRGLGHLLGSGDGAERLLYLLDGEDHTGEISAARRYDLGRALTFSARNPIYAVLHESCWASGTATRWAAERARPTALAPTALAGEHISPAHFETGPLEAFNDIARLLAEHEWPRMWDADKLRGAGARVPAAAAIYVDDAYVPMEHSRAIAQHAQIETWVTNEYEHDGLRASGGRVLDRLLIMTDEQIRRFALRG